MRLASVIAVAGAAVTMMTLASPADAQRRTYRGDRTETITWIDENGRARTRVTVRPRSFLDGGTEVFPGERKFTDYAFPPGYSPMSVIENTAGYHRSPLPGPFDLPGPNNPWPWGW